ncbi:putative uncharacterized phage protein [Aliivibrio wodanis]|uniref:Uncharacterized phage protein n=1 Tax=Aliivibrio wodanis TaxID=80852 RepID=A0A090KJ59_9GAMM|nr:putative uncharacterized phage protein [Aliivibrio wodanis]
MFKVLNAIAYKGATSENNDDRDWNLSPGSSWDANSENVIKFVQKVHEKINSGSKEYSTFKADAAPRSFPTILSEYLEVDGGISFSAFHQNFTEHSLKRELKNSRLEDGAVIVFIHYQLLKEQSQVIGENGISERVAIDELEIIGDKFVVLMVRNTGALKFTSDLQISEVDVIDLKQFIQGCQIDLTRFLAHQASDTEEIDNFLSFIRGGADIRDYFKDAMFAEKGVTNKASCENLEKALHDFNSLHKASLNRTVRDVIEQKVYDFSEEKKGTLVTLEQVGAVVDQCIPNDYAELRGQFVVFANEGIYEINDEFELKSNIIKELVYVSLDVGFATLRLEKSSLGSSTDSSSRGIRFDDASNELTFTATITDPEQLRKIKNIIDE